MIRFGVIGTGWITEDFIKAATLIEDFNLCAIYSRSEKKAKEFSDKYKIKDIYTDLNAMAESEIIDAIYIASPNSLHFGQTVLFMKNKKHVLCEKPIASNLSELKEMIKVAKENNVLLMEALKSTFLPSFKAIQKNLYKIGKVRRYLGNFSKYSSRYDLFKEGKGPNAFNLNFSSGALMDLGVYCIYPLIALFGKPISIKATSLLLESGVDGEGTVSLKYEHMDGVIMYSKITDSFSPSEIQGEKGTMIIEKISNMENIKIHYRNGEVEDISQVHLENNMYYEVKEFINLINNKKFESDVNTYKLSMDVMEIMDNIRKQCGIVFPADMETHIVIK